MKTFTQRSPLGRVLAFIAIMIAPYPLWSEGTRQLAPNPEDIVMLFIGKSDYGNFAQYNAPAASRLNIRIKNPGEIVYLGLSREYTSNGLPEGTGSYEFRIRRSSDNAIVHGPFTVSAFNENVHGWSDAFNGPAALDGQGYSTANPLFVFNPDEPGDYYLEFNNVAQIGFWDITVANNGQAIDGRVYSMNWAFRTPPAFNEQPECVWDRQFAGTLYSYTVDGFVSKIDFANSGFQGLSFSVAFNRKGPGSSGNLELDRQSVPNANLSGNAAEHRIFLNEPDELSFPSGECGQVDMGASFQCADDGSFCLPASVTRPGQLEVILDFNHNGIYDPGLDVLLLHAFEGENLSTCLAWNGLRADGTAPSAAETVDLLVKYTQGVHHWALYDGEFLKNGFCVETIRPACEFEASSNNLYWDDRNIAVEPGTGQPKDGRIGCPCQTDNCRTWNNFNTNLPSCDLINDAVTTGYGDKHTLNTWWFASTRVRYVGNIPITGGTIIGPAETCANTSAELTLSLNTTAVLTAVEWLGPDGEVFSSGDGSNTTVTVDLPGLYTAIAYDDLGCRTEVTHELTWIVCPADLELDKEVNNPAPAIGESVTFTITLDNYGPGAASGFSVQDALPPGLINIANISNGGTLLGNTIAWQGLSLEVGQTLQLTYQATVGLAFNYTNLASVSASNEDDVDSTPGNEVDTDQDGDVTNDPDDEDDGDGVVLVPQACGIQAEVTNVLCDDNGTPVHPEDDRFTFTLVVTGANNSAAWTATGLPGPAGGLYNTPVTLGPYAIADYPGGVLTFNIYDNFFASACATTLNVAVPATCSNQCEISAEPGNIICLDNGTPSNPTDDLYTFQVRVTGFNTSTGWVAENGQTGNYGEWVDFGPFPISSVPQISLTFKDLTDDNCITILEVQAPPPCSDDCDIVNVAVSDVFCNDNGTPSDPADDVFTFHLTVDGFNTADHWVASNGVQGPYNQTVLFGPYPIAAGPVSFTVTDAVDNACISSTVFVSPPGTCSEQCALTHQVIGVNCLDNDTPYDPSDDLFEFTALVIPVNHPSDGWTSNDGNSGLYGNFATFGPYPISAGPVSIAVTDNGDAACTTVISVNPPETCSDLCLIKATVISTDCDDRGTTDDPYDDTFTYMVEVTGLNLGDTWTGSDGSQGAYGENVVSVPLPLIDGERTIQITDTQTGCTAEITVTPPLMEFECPPDTDRGTFLRNVQLIKGQLDENDARFENIDSLCWLPANYFTAGDHYYDLTSFQLHEVLEPKPFTFFLFSRMEVGTEYPEMPQDMVDGTGAVFAGLYNFDDPCCFTQVAGQQPYPLIQGILDNPTVDTTGFFQGNYTPVLKLTMLINPESVYTLLTTSWLPDMYGDYVWVAVNNEGLTLSIISGDVTTQIMPSTRISQDLLYQDADYIMNNRETFFSLGQPEFSSFCGFDSLMFEDRISPWDICEDIDLTREFRILDIFGQIDTCLQHITLRRPVLNDLVLPPAAVMFGCGDEYETLENGFPTPGETGFPLLLTLDGYEELSGNFNYNIVVVYKDKQVYLSGFDTTFVRQWTIIDQCDQDTLLKFDQLIKIGAFSAPILECPLTNHYCPILEEDIMLFSTDPFECTATLEAPWPVVTDTCGGNNTNWAITTEILQTFNGDTTILYIIGPEDDRVVSGLPLGDYWFRYTLSDGDGHEYQHSCRFRVADLDAPTAVCKQDIHVALNNQGRFRLLVSQVNHGSYDNCAIASIELRRLYNRDPLTCDTLLQPYFSEWGPYAEFGCCDIGLTQIVVEMRVTDVNGNINFCWLYVTVEDKTPPLCTGLTNQTLSCETLPDDFNPFDTVQLRQLFGWPDVIDNCVAYAFELDPLVDLEDCGGGTIIRRFRAIDIAGNLSVGIFTQTLTVTSSREYEIRFPRDAVTDCLDYADSLWLRKTGCDSFEVRIADEFLPVQNGECYNVLRTFHIINWCEYNGIAAPVIISRDEDCDGLEGEENIWVLRRQTAAFADRDSLETNLIPATGERGAACGPANPEGYWRDLSSTGYWIYRQRIRIFDEQSPVITFAGPAPFCTDGPACEGNVLYPFTLTEGCVLDSIAGIRIFLDAGADGTIDQDLTSAGVLSGDHPNYRITGVFPIGNHRFEVIAIDGCGNEGAALLPFSVVDCYVPDPQCRNGLIVNLQALPPNTDIDGDGETDVAAVTVQASELASCEETDCTEPLRFSVNRPGETPDPDRTSITFTCDDRYSAQLEVYVWDSAGNPYAVQPDGTIGGPNFKWCEATVYIQDPDGICPNCADQPEISGGIATQDGRSLNGVEVRIESTAGFESTLSDQEGNYHATTSSPGTDYVVRPYLNEGFLDGVNTLDIILIQAHLLGNKTLESPYDLIAADVNRSGNITALDLIELRQLILGNVPGFSNNTSWRFVDAGYQFPHSSNPWFETFPESKAINDLESCLSDVNFVAIKIGDVNGSVHANEQGRGLGAQFILSTPDMDLMAGETYEIPVKTLNGEWVEGFQFTLEADLAKIEILEVKPGLAPAGQFSEQFLQAGLATFCWNSNSAAFKGTVENQALFTLVVKARENSALQDGLNISSKITPAAAFDARGETVEIALAFNRTGANAAGLRLLPNRPNPFSDFTVIGFTLPGAGQATLRVLDLNGREIQSWRGGYPKGYSEETFRAGGSLPEGVYIYSLETQWGSVAMRMAVAN